MSELPSDLLYTREHEWIKRDGDSFLVGITDHAQESLGDITYLELPEAGSSFDKGEVFGVVESVKAASDLYMPLAGEVIESNQALVDAPESINDSPYDTGWMIRIRATNDTESDQLLNAADYSALL